MTAPSGPMDFISRRCSPDPTSECWIWNGKLNPKGYGTARRKRDVGKGSTAQRVVWTLMRGKIPEGMTVDHLCKVRCCVNPDHMELVPLRENIMRGNTLAAANSAKEKCPKCGGEFSWCRHASGKMRRKRVPCAYRRVNERAIERRNENASSGLQEAGSGVRPQNVQGY